MTKSNEELPSTYFVPHRIHQREEMTRLQVQDQMITTGMGGVLAEQPDPAQFHSVLDVGCGTGGWLIDAAKSYPTLSHLVGIDINSKMLAFARTQARSQGVEDRVTFREMDALRSLDFPKHSFDLVNHRLASSYLRLWDWPEVLAEYQRVCRSGGTIRVTEGGITVSNSPALTRISGLFATALHQAGRYVTPDKDGITQHLVLLLQRHGFQEVQTHAYNLEYRAGTPEWHLFYKNMNHGFRTLALFFQKWTRVPENYETLCQQALTEMQQPTFVAIFPLLTAWGTVSKTLAEG